jgi:ribosomal-protein-alanine N-acetyltransferase
LNHPFQMMNDLSFDPFPTLSTKRLVLRKVIAEDAEQLYELRSNEQVMRYIDKEKTKSVEEAKERIRSYHQDLKNTDGVQWAICYREQPQNMIGVIGFFRMEKEHFRGEVGYLLMPDHHRKGLMQEALQRVIQYGFEDMGLHSIEAQVNTGNEASIALLEKCGFVREGYFRENYYFNGRFLDTGVYSLLRPST